ncbi:MAG: alanine--tRNA ligase [Rhodospirillaceae bacterium]|nr:alanine--tRNA ligase [Rhodospirillaceae bacterium]|tara:strand:+ start:7403 stop:10057 length:2655 start_codon:yes stop_codon:yes gene_type:complete
MVSVRDIRSKFLEYFNKNGHEIVNSSSLVPQNDPSLLFTNSGMVQFKNVFTGSEVREYNRAVTTQKCVRAGGKHNDLDNVGYTTRHHTFFEMLGNFSFGDYFKDEAIELAWNLITKEYDLSKEKLLITIFDEDDESEDIWKKISGFDDSKIIKIKSDDNFWRMGEFGPCGPCSEIFFDHGDKVFGGPPGSKDENGDRFVEIWNLVFMQYEEKNDGRVLLPKPSIDTGMGLERISAILQGKTDNYEIDLIKKIILKSSELSNSPVNRDKKVSHRVIADHLRSTSFLIADGVMPSNEGRGYVLRRIMRRAMRHVHIIGVKDPFIYKLVPILVSEMGDIFPELKRAEDSIKKIIKKEEQQFNLTLERGLNILEDELNNLSQGNVLPGEIAFKLYDTYGFPLDLTQDALKPKGLKVDLESFNTHMKKQKEVARASWKGSGDKTHEEIWFKVKDKIGSTIFSGYEEIQSDGEVLAILIDRKENKKASVGDKVDLILNNTPFYGESGGQIGDIGEIKTKNNCVVDVEDTIKILDNLYIHKCIIRNGELILGDMVTSYVNKKRRLNLAANHSATHLLHSALRKVLGSHVNQKGSLVTDDKLRFDISHPNQISFQEIIKIENIVNHEIRSNQLVNTDTMDYDKAFKSGALALFGEKYSDKVRVVTMGNKNSDGEYYSSELCGGTHVTRTGDIGFFKIINESSVSSGVRRIEALTGEKAIVAIQKDQNIILDISNELKTSKIGIKSKISHIIKQKKELEDKISKLKIEKLKINDDENEFIRKINSLNFYNRKLINVNSGEIRNIVDNAKKLIQSGVVLVFNINEDKVSLVVGVTSDLSKKINAVEIAKIASANVGGKGGGGRSDFAQAGGTQINKIDETVILVEKEIYKIINR